MAGISDAELNRAEARLDVRLPADYREYMRFRDGFDESVGEEGSLQVYSLETMLEVNDAAADLQRLACPGLVYFGSDVSREGFGWDTREAEPPVLMVQITTAGWVDAIRQADNFRNFLAQVEAEGDFRWE